jgi:hypothetical protein
VARTLEQPLHIERAVAEGRRRLAARCLDRVGDLRRVADAAHALAASACRSLDQHRQPDAFDRPRQPGVRLVVGRVARDDRHARSLHQFACFDLRPHAGDDARRRSNERELLLFAGPGKRRILGKESVAGVDGVGAAERGRLEQAGDRQITFRRGRRSNPDGAIRGAYVGRAGVGLGVHRHALDAELCAGMNDAKRDLSAVRNEDPADHAV